MSVTANRRAAAEGRRAAGRRATGLHAAIGILRRAALGHGPARRGLAAAQRAAGSSTRPRRSSTTGRVPGRLGNRHPSITPYETFAAADGELVIACGNDADLRLAVRRARRPELAADPRFALNDARYEHREQLLRDHIAAIVREETVGEWVQRTARGARAGRAGQRPRRGRSPSPTSSGSAPWTRPAASTRSPRRFRLSGTPAGVRLPPPGLGEHDAEIRRWLEARPDEGPARRAACPEG